MRWVTLLLASLLAYAVASDTIKPLFETDAITAYDRWLWDHRNEYPGFRMIRAQAGLELTPSGWTRLYAVSFTDSGTVRKRYVYPDSLDLRNVALQMFCVSVAEDGDRFAVRRWLGPNAGTTAYDRLGRKLFDSGRDVFPRFGLWFRDIGESESTQVLNDRGLVIGVLPGASIRTASSSGDTLFVATSRAGTIVFDRNAKVHWRDDIPRSGPYVPTISSDGREVRIAARDSVVLHDLTTGITTAKAVDSAMKPRQRPDLIAWSSDGRRVAMYRIDSEVPDSATLWIVTRDGTLASPATRLAASYTERLFWMGDTAVLVASPYVPDRRQWPIGPRFEQGPCKVTTITLSGKTQELTVTGHFGELGGWYQQGRHLAYLDTQLHYFAVFLVPAQ